MATVLPKDVVAALGPIGKKNIYYKDLPRELTDKMWRQYREGIEPLKRSGKLVAVHFQFAPWVACHPSGAPVKGNGRAKRRQSDAVSQRKRTDAASPETARRVSTGQRESVDRRCNPISAAERVQEQSRSCRHPFCPFRPWHLPRPSFRSSRSSQLHRLRRLRLFRQARPSFRSSPSSQLHRLRRFRLFLQARPTLLVVRQVREQVRLRQPEA